LKLVIKSIGRVRLKINLVLLFSGILFVSTLSFGQSADSKLFSGDEFKLKLNNRTSSSDTIKTDFKKSTTQKIKIGGLFLAPSIGVAFPAGEFKDYSVAGLILGVKAEIAYIKFYPFIFGFVYEYQTNSGNGEYVTTNSFTNYDTKITYIGGSLDIVLSKFIRTDFTTPIFSFELKYASVVNDVGFENSSENYSIDNSLLTYSFGLGFTLYVFDLSGKYTFASPYSTLTFQGKFHFPLIKF
jgi:hypothetical protein